MTSDDQALTAEVIRLATDSVIAPLADADQARLNELLEQSEPARRVYLQCMQDAQSLRDWAEQAAWQSAPTAARATVEEPAPAPVVLQFLLSALDWRRHTLRFAVLVLALTGWFWIWLLIVLGSGPRQQSVAERSESLANETTVAARVTALRDAQWADQALAPRGRAALPAGATLALASGSIELTFQSGAKAQIAGPTLVRLVSSNACRLERGRLVAQVSPAAAGFIVDTPLVKLIDLGTEFGVEVRDGASESTTAVVVLHGAVEARPHDPQTEPARQRLVAGEAWELHRGEAAPREPEDAAFDSLRARFAGLLHYGRSGWTSLTVRNGNFEEPTDPPLLGEGVQTGIREGVPPGWQLLGGDAQVGVYNPDPLFYSNVSDTNPTTFGTLRGMDGPRLAYLVFGTQPTEIGQTLVGDDGLPNTADDPVLLAGARYRLRAAVGHRGAEGGNFAGYAVQLWAGGQLLAEASDLQPPGPFDAFADVTVEFQTPAAHPQLGQPLSIRLKKLRALETSYVDYDAVRLEVLPSKQPESAR